MTTLLIPTPISLGVPKSLGAEANKRCDVSVRMARDLHLSGNVTKRFRPCKNRSSHGLSDSSVRKRVWTDRGLPKPKPSSELGILRDDLREAHCYRIQRE